MEEFNTKDYGYKNNSKIKLNKKNKKNIRNRTDRRVKFSSNSHKCCSFCSPKFSIRCENSKQINNIINYDK